MFTQALKRSFALFLSLALFSQPLMAQSYDFFKDPMVRIDEAAELLKKSLVTKGDMHTAFAQIQAAAQDGSLKELSTLYASKEISVEGEEAFLMLFLERLRDCYYIHLDRIESALPYWEWAKHHPYRYTASQFPHKWVSHDANQAEVDKIYTMINGLRTVYSKEFGIVVRLLAMRCEDKIDAATWLAEVQKGVATLLMTSLESLKTTEQIIQKLANHEDDVAKMVERVQKPGWLKRHWRLLLTTAVVAGAASYYYVNNKTTVDNTCLEGVEKVKTNFMDYCYNPVKSFVEKFWRINNAPKNDTIATVPQKIIDKEVSYKITKGDVVTVLKSHDEAEALYNATQLKADNAIKSAMDSFKKVENATSAMQSVENKDVGTYTLANAISAGIKPYAVEGMQFAKEIKDNTAQGSQHLLEAVAETKSAVDIKIQVADQDKRAILAYANQLLQYGEQQVHNTKQVMNEKLEKIDFTFQLACLIPAGLFTYGGFQGVRNIFGWFTKRDRSTLINRMSQAEQVLIRTTHKVELDNAEYGRMLYLLMKAYDQVAKNVLSDERIAFLNDLTYVADAQSSIEQKQKTIDSMWRKYRSLEKVS